MVSKAVVRVQQAHTHQPTDIYKPRLKIALVCLGDICCVAPGNWSEASTSSTGCYYSARYYDSLEEFMKRETTAPGREISI